MLGWARVNSQGQLEDMHGYGINYPWFVIFGDALEKLICPFSVIYYRKRETKYPLEMTIPMGQKEEVRLSQIICGIAR